MINHYIVISDIIPITHVLAITHGLAMTNDNHQSRQLSSHYQQFAVEYHHV